MREIKFRAWNEELKRMAYTSDKHWKTYGWWGAVLFAGDDVGETLMQYTGLKDKNGKEIYEGDIILGDAVVVWRNEPELDRDHCCFGIANGKYTLGTYSDRDDFEVIGNIYETSELITTT